MMKLIKLISTFLFLIITTPIVLILYALTWGYGRLKQLTSRPLLEIKLLADENGLLSERSLQEMKAKGFNQLEIDHAKYIAQMYAAEAFVFRNGMRADEIEWLSGLINEEVESGKETSDNSPPVPEEVSEDVAVSLFNQGKTEACIAMYERLTLSIPERASYYQSQIKVLRSL